MANRDTILIVDDIEMNRAILSELFKDKYRILEADNGYDAVAIADENNDKIAVILLDMIMPKKDGVETLRELKDFGITNIIPTVLMSAEFNDESLFNGHEYGACDIIEKPFDPHAVLRRIDNLVELYEHRVCRAELDALLDARGVRDEQVVADDLDAVAEAAGHQLPALPVVLAHAVLDGDDRVLVNEALPHVDHLLAGHHDAALRQMIALVLLAVPVGHRAVYRDAEVLAGLVARLLNRRDKRLQRVLVAVEIRRIAALVAHAGRWNYLLERVEHLGAHAQRLMEALRADRHYHELLNVHVRAGGVLAAVENVHHRHGQSLGVDAADVVIQADAGCGGCCLRAGEGHAEDGVRAETGLVRGAVDIYEHLVNRGLIQHVHADQALGDLGIDSGHRFGDAFAQIAVFITVTQLYRFMRAGRRS